MAPRAPALGYALLETCRRRLASGAVGDMDAAKLAREWTRPIRYHDVRRILRDARLVTRVAETFQDPLAGAEADADRRLTSVRPPSTPRPPG